MHTESQWFLCGLGSTPHGFKRASTTERWKTNLTLQNNNSQLVLNQTLRQQGIEGNTATLSCDSCTYVPTDYIIRGKCPISETLRHSCPISREALKAVWTHGTSHVPRNPETSPWTCDSTKQSAKFDIRWQFRPKPFTSHSAKYSPEFDIWLPFHPKPWTSDSAKQSSEIDIWWEFQPKPWASDSAKQSSGLDIWSEFQPRPWGRLKWLYQAACRIWHLAKISTNALNEWLCQQSSEFGFWQEFQPKPWTERVTLPSNLQTLAFGQNFNQRLKRVTLPSNLECLTFGRDFNQKLDQVMLPSNLQSLTFGRDFNHSLEQVTLPSNPQSLTFGLNFNQCLERVTLPSNLQSLTFGQKFIQCLERVTLPSSLQSLTFGQNLSLARFILPSNLQRWRFQWENRWSESTKQPAEFDIWSEFQPKPDESGSAKHSRVWHLAKILTNNRIK